MSDPQNGREDALRAAGRGDQEEAPAFRVIDRRRFAPDGSEREAESEQEKQAEPAKQESARAEQRTAPAGEAGQAASAGGPALAMPKGEPYEGTRDSQIAPTFATLIISLSTQALMYLGEIPDLEGGATRKDLSAARNIIDWLGVLERKTAGNLDAEEEALLSRILYDLRMRFVALSRR